MGSLRAHLDRSQQARDARQYVIDDAEFSVDVYRRLSQTSAAGLSQEVADADPLRTINIRVDPRGDDLIGLTDDTDVLKDDLWRWTDIRNQTRWLRVVAVHSNQASTDVRLREILK